MIDWNTSSQELTRGAGLGLLVVGMIYQQRTQGNSSCTVSKVATVNVATGYNKLPGVARSFHGVQGAVWSRQGRQERVVVTGVP